jgi:hypothetical protein
MPTNTNFVPPAPTQSVSDLYAQLTRQQWYDYMNTLGVPQENKLIEYATDPNVVSNAMAEASQDVNSSFDRAQQLTDSRTRGLGTPLQADEQHAITRSLGLQRSLADVGAQNRARDQTTARQQAVLGNPAPKIGGLG